MWLSHFSDSPCLEGIGKNATWQKWWNYIVGKDYHCLYTFHLFPTKELAHFLFIACRDFKVIALILVIIFLFYHRVHTTQQNHVFTFLGLAGLGELLNALSHHIWDIEVYYIPVFLIGALLLAKVADLIVPPPARRITAALLFLSGLLNVGFTYPALNDPSKQCHLYPRLRALAEIAPAGAKIWTPFELLNSDEYTLSQIIKFIRYMTCSEKNLEFSITATPPAPPFYTFDELAAHLDHQKYDSEPACLPFRSLSELICANFDKLIVIAAMDEASQGLSSEIKSNLQQFGLSLDKLGVRHSYIAIIKNRKVLWEEIGKNKPLSISKHKLRALGLDKLEFVYSAGYDVGNSAKIIYDKADFSAHRRGLNILIVDENQAPAAFWVDANQNDRVQNFIYKVVPNFSKP